MFSRVKRLFKPNIPAPHVLATPSSFTSPKSWNEAWQDIEKFEAWVQTQPGDVCIDLLCRIALRLLPTVLVDDAVIVDGSGFERTLDASIEILACQLDLSCNRPNIVKPWGGQKFFELCEGGNGIYAGTTWHAIESCADGIRPAFRTKYLGEVVANIRRKTPEHSINYDRFFGAVLADCSAWEAWTKAGADRQTRADLMMSPLWSGREPVDMHVEGLPRMQDYLVTKGGYHHLLLLSIFNR